MQKSSYSLLTQGQNDAARAQAEAALDLVRTVRTTPSVALSATHAQIEILWNEAVEIRVTRLEAYILILLGNVQQSQGDYAAAHISRAHCLRLYQEIGEQNTHPDIFNSIGEDLRMQGAYADAHRAYDQCIQLARAIGNINLEGYGFANTALVAHHQHNDTLARTLSEQALTIAQTFGMRHLEACACINLGHALEGLGQLAAARASYQAALELWRGLDNRQSVTESQAGLARVAMAQGDHTQALTHVETILAFFRDGGTLYGADEPLQISLTCYELLHATDDPRAAGVLTTAHATLLEQAAKISDPAMQRSFLENVPYHRAIVEAWVAQHAQSSYDPNPTTSANHT